MILKHLKKGLPITHAQAANKYSIWRLASRINELRQQGHNIVTTMIGSGRKRYAQYTLSGGGTG